MGLPKQKIPLRKKNKEWRESCVKELIDGASFGSAGSVDYKEMYNLYDGVLDPNEYKYLTDPYNSTRDKAIRRNFPAKLRNYNIIKPVVDILLGEKSKRPSNYRVVVKNPEAVSERKQAEYDFIKRHLQQMYANALAKQGIDIGQEQQETPPPEQLKQLFNMTYDDARAQMGQDAIDYINHALDMPDKLQDAFFDFIITSAVITYKTVVHDDIFYEVIMPSDVDYQKSPGIKFIEDGDWVVRRMDLTKNEIIDLFYELIHDSKEEDDILEYLDEDGIDTRSNAPIFSATQSEKVDDLITVYHVCWKSWTRKGILQYLDEYNQPQEMEVDESYIFDKEEGDLNIEWYWVNEVWEGYRIADKFYLGIEPLAIQRNSIGNLSECKLPYNGRVYSQRTDASISVPALGKPYQILYNVFHYKLEQTINKNKDKIALIEINTIPKKPGWDEETFMYFADSMSYAFIDSTAEGARGDRVAFSNYQVLDMSLSQYIEKQWNLMVAVKQEWEELMGINRQRKGQMNSSDGYGVTERAVFQSSIMSEEFFRRFEVFERTEYQGFLDLSKYAWVNGKKAYYVGSDFKTAVLDIDPASYVTSDLGVFAISSSVENEKLQTLKQLSLQFSQNAAKPSTIAEILDSNSFANIKRLLKEAEQAESELQARMEQAKAEAAERAIALQNENREDIQMFQSLENEKDRQLQRELKIMELQAKGMETPEEPEDDTIEREKLNIEREKIATEERISDKDRASKERIESSKQTTQKQIAKTRKPKSA